MKASTLSDGVLGSLIASALFALLMHVARRVRANYEGGYGGRRSQLKAIYFGKYLDFFLGYARTEFITIATASVLLNLVGAVILYQCQGFLFCDTAGTALAAFVLGPWWGASIGLVTNLFGTLVIGVDTKYHEFGLVNAALGATWGFYAVLLREDVTRLELKSAVRVLASILRVGLVGTAVSSVLACAILLPIHEQGGWDTVPNSFHFGLYQYLQSTVVDPSSSLGRFGLFVLAELVFNIPDKILSVSIAMALVHVAFPISKLFDNQAKTINFIKASSGSHLFFVGLCGIYCWLAWPIGLGWAWAWVLLVGCVVSYLIVPWLGPSDLTSCNILAGYFKERQAESVIWQHRKQAMLAAIAVGTCVFAYVTFVYLAGSEIGAWKQMPEELTEGRNVIVLLLFLAFMFLAVPSIMFLTRRLEQAEDDLQLSFGLTAPRPKWRKLPPEKEAELDHNVAESWRSNAEFWVMNVGASRDPLRTYLVDPWLVEWFNERRSGVMLDLACGEGRLFRWGYKCAGILGIERDPRLSVAAQQQIAGRQGMGVVRADLRRLPVANQSVTSVVASLAFEDCTDLRGAILEIRRVIVRDGELVIVMLHPSAEFDPKIGYGRAQYVEKPFHVSGQTSPAASFRIHRSIEQVFDCLVLAGFSVRAISEPTLNPEVVREHPYLSDWQGRPRFLFLRAIAT
jgi:ubiquinone/menaquinone biosynthesis C-methylase UbiE